jgi:hypothetical protein
MGNGYEACSAAFIGAAARDRTAIRLGPGGGGFADCIISRGADIDNDDEAESSARSSQRTAGTADGAFTAPGSGVCAVRRRAIAGDAGGARNSSLGGVPCNQWDTGGERLYGLDRTAGSGGYRPHGVAVFTVSAGDYRAQSIARALRTAGNDRHGAAGRTVCAAYDCARDGARADRLAGDDPPPGSAVCAGCAHGVAVFTASAGDYRAQSIARALRSTGNDRHGAAGRTACAAGDCAHDVARADRLADDDPPPGAAVCAAHAAGCGRTRRIDRIERLASARSSCAADSVVCATGNRAQSIARAACIARRRQHGVAGTIRGVADCTRRKPVGVG